MPFIITNADYSYAVFLSTTFKPSSAALYYIFIYKHREFIFMTIELERISIKSLGLSLSKCVSIILCLLNRF